MTAPGAAEGEIEAAARFLVIDERVATDYDGQARHPSEHKKPVGVPALFGTRYHGVLKYLLEGVDPSDYALWWHDHYADQPAVVQSWAIATEDSLPIIEELTAPDEGNEGIRLTEVPLNIGKLALQAAAEMKEQLLVEQRRHRKRPGWLEKVLTHYPGFLPPYADDTKFNELIDSIPKNFPYSRDELFQHLDEMRAFRLTGNRKVLFPPTARLDLVLLEHKAGDADAKRTREAFRTVLKKGVGFDLDKLYEPISHVFVDPQTLEEAEGKLLPADVVYEALSMIQEGTLKLKIADHKTISRLKDDLGKAGVSELFSEVHLASDSPYAEAANNLLMSYFRSLARTLYALRAWVTHLINEFGRDPERAGDLHLDADLIMDQVDASLLIADCDLSDPETRPDEDNGNHLEYQTDPPIEEVGTPTKIEVIDISMNKTLLSKYWELWERHVHIMALMGLFAVKGTVLVDTATG